MSASVIILLYFAWCAGSGFSLGAVAARQHWESVVFYPSLALLAVVNAWVWRLFVVGNL